MLPPGRRYSPAPCPSGRTPENSLRESTSCRRRRGVPRMPPSKRGAQAAAMRGEKLLLSRSKYGRPSLAAPPSWVSIKPQSAVGTPRQPHLIPALEPGPEAAVETGIHGNRNDLIAVCLPRRSGIRVPQPETQGQGRVNAPLILEVDLVFVGGKASRHDRALSQGLALCVEVVSGIHLRNGAEHQREPVAEVDAGTRGDGKAAGTVAVHLPRFDAAASIRQPGRIDREGVKRERIARPVVANKASFAPHREACVCRASS